MSGENNNIIDTTRTTDKRTIRLSGRNNLKNDDFGASSKISTLNIPVIDKSENMWILGIKYSTVVSIEISNVIIKNKNNFGDSLGENKKNSTEKLITINKRNTGIKLNDIGKIK